MDRTDRMLRGTVTRTDAQGAYVEVPALGLGVEFGPCQVYSAPISMVQGPAGHTHTVDSTGDAVGAHQHAVTTTGVAAQGGLLVHGRAALRKGDPVLVSTVNGVADDLVMVGRLT